MNIFFGQKLIFNTQHYFGPESFEPKIFVDPTFLWIRPKILFIPNFLDPFFYTKPFSYPTFNCFGTKLFEPNSFLQFCGPKNYFRLKIFCRPKIFWTQFSFNQIFFITNMAITPSLYTNVPPQLLFENHFDERNCSKSG